MRIVKTILAAGLLVAVALGGHAQPGPVAQFNKVIVSPYIQVTFVQGDKEGVRINDMIVDSSKLHVEVEDGTLWLYLDGAKEVPHNQHTYNGDGNGQSHHPYPDHSVTATVTYKTLNSLSLRGDENHVCQSPLTVKNFTLRVYGDGKIAFNEVHFGEMHTTMYGEGSLDIKAGSVDEQYYLCYGEGKVNTTAVTGHESKITAYGEARLNLNVSDRIKITAFGEAHVRYMGSPSIVKWLHFGELDLKKID
jgi:hypothetical protein